MSLPEDGDGGLSGRAVAGGDARAGQAGHVLKGQVTHVRDWARAVAGQAIFSSYSASPGVCLPKGRARVHWLWTRSRDFLHPMGCAQK